MNLNPIILILITVAIVVGVVGAFLILQPTTAPTESGTTTPSPTETTSVQQTQTTMETQTSIGEVDIEGPWYGTFSSRYGTGRWAARIKKEGNRFIGILSLTGPYQVEAMGIQIELIGNQITFGWAGGATFTGTVAGDTMSGTWEAPGGVDSGSWSGQRGETDITPEWPTETTATSPSTSPTQTSPTTTTSETTTPTFPNEAIAAISNDIMDALAQVYGGATLLGYAVPGNQYVLVYNISTNAADPYTEGQLVLDIMISKGYQLVSSAPTSEGYIIYLSKVIDNAQYQIIIGINRDSSEVGVSIALM